MDLFEVAEHGGGSAERAMAGVDARRALIAGASTDWLFPLWQQRELAGLLEQAGADVTFHALDAIQGHDAFLIDEDRFAPMMASFLEGMPD
jgi:homoserine acetyltransferase